MHVTYKYKGQRSVLLPSTPWVTGTELSPTPLPTEPLTSPVISVLIIVLPPPPPRIPGHKCGFTLVSQGWRMNPGPRESVLFTFYKTCSLWFHLRNAAVPQDGPHIRDAFVKNLQPLIRWTFILPPLSLAGVLVNNQTAAEEDKQMKLFGCWILGS